MLEGSKDSNFWTPLAVIQGLLGIWFAASHQPWIVRITSRVLRREAEVAKRISILFSWNFAIAQNMSSLFETRLKALKVIWITIQSVSCRYSIASSKNQYGSIHWTRVSTAWIIMLLGIIKLTICFSLVAIRRKAVQPFVFRSTGCRVPVGQIVCVPAWEFMHDKSRYPNPEDFDGHRFVRNSQSRRPSFPENPMRGTTFTDASEDFPIWGLGSKVW